MSLNDKLISWCPKRFTYFYRIISQPKSDYRPIEFVQTQQAIYIHQVNNQTNLKYVGDDDAIFLSSLLLAVPQLPLHH